MKRIAMFVVLAASAAAAVSRPRVIATTDGEIDDRCSMVRFLMYANEWRVEGIIHSSSKYHWKGDAAHKRKNWADESWLDREIDAYARVYPNLKQHDPDYPTPEHLRKQVFVGNVAFEGDMSAPTPGSDHIVRVLLNPDPSPVWLQAWGGANTIARALKTIEEKYPERKAEVARKARLFLISRQDNTLDAYIVKHWPNTTVLLCTAYSALAYGWRGIMTPAQQEYFDARWMKRNILTGHGPLCAMYEANRDGSFRSEGDSPSFMHVIEVGLANRERPDWGGWGGRFRRGGHYWISTPDGGDRYRPILRWAAAFQNDWAARAEWCVKPYAACNHPPRPVVNGDASRRALHISARPGQEVRLSAEGSSDPDNGDALRYRWWTYTEAGTYWDAAPIRGADGIRAAVTVPAEAAGRTIHIILEVTDAGRPPLTRYRRIVIQVAGKPRLSPHDLYLQTPITRLSGPPPESGTWSFFRGINLNGPAVTIDGNHWEGGDAPDFECDGRALNTPRVPLRPPTDAARAAMIHAFRWSTRLTARMRNVPKGSYAVYVYLWEDNNPESLTVRLNGKVVAPHHLSGVAGEWHRLGPWMVEVADGDGIRIECSGGAANLSGLEAWCRR